MNAHTPRHRLSNLAFRHRRFISSGTLVIGIILKIALNGRSIWPLWFLGLGLVLLGLVFRVYAAAHLLGRHVVTEIEAETLCAAGPFAYVRNPLYIGNFIIGLGVSLTLNEWYCYLLFALEFSLMYALIIPYEEGFLSEKFKSAYASYRAATRRFFPRLKPYEGKTAVSPDYRSALIGESLHALVLFVAYGLFYILFMARF